MLLEAENKIHMLKATRSFDPVMINRLDTVELEMLNPAKQTQIADQLIKTS